MASEKTGVILLNMGGPEKLAEVAPFLYKLFSDRDIIRLGPRILQKPLAWWISRKRAPKSQVNYAKIGGGSPLTAISIQQGKALEQALSDSGSFSVTCAMRYWHPRADQALKRMAEQSISRIIALPLYPHYSCATTGSSLTDLQKTAATSSQSFDIEIIESWPEQESYINALAENIMAGAAEFTGTTPTVVYSAHSLPVSFIEEGDPYVDHIRQTIAALEKRTALKGELCFQSRSGPVEWLSPSTPDMLTQLADKGCKNILMVPISFVSDHIETLYEIDILYRDQARQLGMELRSSKSLNTNPLFIKGLQELVLQKIQKNP